MKNASSSCLDFTNMFSKLKNFQRQNKAELFTLPSASTRARPKSMYAQRTKNIPQKTIMRHSLYNRKFFSTTSNQKAFKFRSLTQQSSQNRRHIKTEGAQNLKYLAINNFCLKKIQKTQKNEDEKQQEQDEQKMVLKVKQLQININVAYTNPQKVYKKTTLRSYKKHKLSNSIYKSSDISTVVEGHKIF